MRVYSRINPTLVRSASRKRDMEAAIKMDDQKMGPFTHQSAPGHTQGPQWASAWGLWGVSISANSRGLLFGVCRRRSRSVAALCTLHDRHGRQKDNPSQHPPSSRPARHPINTLVAYVKSPRKSFPEELLLWTSSLSLSLSTLLLHASSLDSRLALLPLSTLLPLTSSTFHLCDIFHSRILAEALHLPSILPLRQLANSHCRNRFSTFPATTTRSAELQPFALSHRPFLPAAFLPPLSNRQLE